jgi:transposase-like protein
VRIAARFWISLVASLRLRVEERLSRLKLQHRSISAMVRVRKWRLKYRAVADSLEEAGDRVFTFTRFPPSQWKSIRTSNAIERLHEEFKRRIKTQTILPCAETAAMLFWALLRTRLSREDGWCVAPSRPPGGRREVELKARAPRRLLSQ